MIMMRVRDEIMLWPKSRLDSLIASATSADVDRALAREERTLADLAALISPEAIPRIEEMAQEAQRLTRWHFGRTVSLYAPIYISNVCAADCAYCWFASHSNKGQKRTTLTPDEIRHECEALAGRGFQSVLLLTGEAPKVVGIDYLVRAVAIAREYFHSVSVEIYALDTEGYRRLVDAGLEGVTLHMETYDRETYARLHTAGVKRDYDYRLDALERAGTAGARRINLGVLLGLYDWRIEALWMGLHARHLQRQCWQIAVAVSFPRLRHAPNRFQPAAPVADRYLVQLIVALRLFLPEAGFALSTREPAWLRDRLIPLGVTMMSAGSSTRPGGYATSGPETLEQFEVKDTRSPEEVVAAIRNAGYDPVWKDFDTAFCDAESPHGAIEKDL